MILVHCQNCGQLIVDCIKPPQLIMKPTDDSVQRDVQCHDCREIYRITVNRLQGGNKVDNSKYWETYDAEGNRVSWSKRHSGSQGRVESETSTTNSRPSTNASTNAGANKVGVPDDALYAQTRRGNAG